MTEHCLYPIRKRLNMLFTYYLHHIRVYEFTADVHKTSFCCCYTLWPCPWWLWPRRRHVFVIVVHADGDVVTFHHCHLNFLRGSDGRAGGATVTDRTPPNSSATWSTSLPPGCCEENHWGRVQRGLGSWSIWTDFLVNNGSVLGCTVGRYTSRPSVVFVTKKPLSERSLLYYTHLVLPW